MQKFTAGWGGRATFLFWIGMGCGVLYFDFALIAKAQTTADWAMVVLFSTLCGFPLIAAGYGLLESFAVFSVDADGITRRAWNGMHSMRWKDIVRTDTNGELDSEIVLHDHRERNSRFSERF